jgi:hypothetical protein
VSDPLGLTPETQETASRIGYLAPALRTRGSSGVAS